MRFLLALAAVLLLGLATQGMGQNIHQARYTYQHPLVRGMTSDRVFVIGDQAKGKAPRPYKASPVAIKVGQAVLSAKVQRLAKSEPQNARRLEIEADESFKVPRLFDRVFFPLGSAWLSPTEETDLLGAVKKLPQGSLLQVQGFTCDLGPRSFNDRLALERAERVASLLRDQGFSVKVSARGKSSYLSLDPENRTLNRRAEIFLLSAETSQAQ